MSHCKRVLITAIIWCGFVGGAVGQADDEGIITDRPDQTESPNVVGTGELQIETGFLYADGGDPRSLALPTTLFRVGVTRRFELRFDFGGIEKDFASDEAGLSDFGFGGKVRLWDEKGWIPEAALLFGTIVPIGVEGFSSERFEPDFRFSFAHTITDRVGIGYNLGVAWETSEEVVSSQLYTLYTGRERIDRDTGAGLVYTLTSGIGLTDTLGMFIEVFGDVPLSVDHGPAHSLDGGFTWAPLANLQFDVSAGLGLSGAADDWFAGAGVSIRFPK